MNEEGRWVVAVYDESGSFQRLTRPSIEFRYNRELAMDVAREMSHFQEPTRYRAEPASEHVAEIMAGKILNK